MDSLNIETDTGGFLISAAALLVKSSVSIVDRFREDLIELFPSDTSSEPIIGEVMAFLTSVVLHQAQAQEQVKGASDLNQTFHALKNALVQAAQEDASLLGHANHFDQQAFHDLVACYFKGSLDGFEFVDEEIRVTSEETGLAIPTQAGVDAIFLALLHRLMRYTSIDSMTDPSERKQSTISLTRLTETSVSSFGLALQLLSSGRLDV